MHHHLKASLLQRLAHRPLIAAARLQPDPAHLSRPQPDDQLGDPGRAVLHPDLVLQTMHRRVQTMLADIDPGDLRVRLALFHRPILVASDLKVPATIRVCETSAAAKLSPSAKRSRSEE